MAHNSVGREEAVRRLRAYAKVGIAGSDINFGDALSDETDRGAVILLASTLEDVLEARLKAEMVKLTVDEIARLFGPDAPLGSLSAKTKLAYALGYIDREAVRMIDLFRDMRNACAHSRRNLSFDTPELRDVARVMIAYLSEESVELKEPLVTRLYVAWAVGWLIRYINTGSKEQATALIHGLLDDALQMTREAKVEHEASLKKRRERDALRCQSNRKGLPPRRPQKPSQA